MNEWLYWGITRRGWTGTTPEQYRRRATAADTWMKQQGWAGINRGRADHYEAWWDQLPETAASRNLGRKVLIAYGTWLVETGKRQENPAVGLPRWQPPKSVPKALDHDEAMRVLADVSGRTTRPAIAVLLMLRCGLRIAEVCSLRWRDTTGEWLTVTGKGGKTRRVPLPASLRSELRRWKLACPDGVFVMPWTTQLVRKEVVALVGHLPHSLRHTYATELLEACGDLRVVQEALGHESVATTQIYTAVRPTRMADAVGAMYQAS